MGKKFAGLAVASSAIFCAIVIYLFIQGKPSLEKGPPNFPNQEERDFWYKVQLALSGADEASQEKMEEHFKPIEDFFSQAKTKTPEFADVALSWGSKLRLMADYVPFTSGNRNENFIKRKFEEIVFNPEDFEKALEASIKLYLSKIESIENQLVVNLRQDIADLPKNSSLNSSLDNFNQESFKKNMEEAIRSAGTKAKVEVSKDLVQMIAAEVLAAVGTKFLVSGGVLGVGGAAGIATLGISVIISLIVDQIISYVWDWYANPKDNLAQKVNGNLDEIKNLIIEGTKTGDSSITGLKQRLVDFGRERSKIRNKAINAYFFPGV